MFEQLKELIVNYVDFDPDSITGESRFIEDLGFNSYDFIIFVYFSKYCWNLFHCISPFKCTAIHTA